MRLLENPDGCGVRGAVLAKARQQLWKWPLNNLVLISNKTNQKELNAARNWPLGGRGPKQKTREGGDPRGETSSIVSGK